jgi:mono/diheme cytochrome c family protein
MLARIEVAVAAFGLCVVLGGCKKQQPPAPSGAAPGAQPEEAKVTPEGLAEAKTIFASRCVPCHGANGHGDGPGAAALTPKPRDFHDAQWQSATKDAEIDQAIRFGGAAVGKSPAMPSNPDLLDKPAVVAGLRQTIRNFGQGK